MFFDVYYVNKKQNFENLAFKIKKMKTSCKYDAKSHSYMRNFHKVCPKNVGISTKYVHKM